jgi:hypothetical protein
MRVLFLKLIALRIGTKNRGLENFRPPASVRGVSAKTADKRAFCHTNPHFAIGTHGCAGILRLIVEKFTQIKENVNISKSNTP